MKSPHEKLYADRHDKHASLGRGVLWRCPLAFVPAPDREAVCGGWGVDLLPPALSLAEVAAEIAWVEKNVTGASERPAR
jgi:hypothetical protein